MDGNQKFILISIFFGQKSVIVRKVLFRSGKIYTAYILLLSANVVHVIPGFEDKSNVNIEYNNGTKIVTCGTPAYWILNIIMGPK